MLRHLVNFYVGKNMFEGGLQKIQNEGELGSDFEEKFDVDSNQMKIAGYFEAIGGALLFFTLFSKTLVRIGIVMMNLVLGTAIFKHYKSGDGFEETKGAIKFFGLNTLSFFETFRK